MNKTTHNVYLYPDEHAAYCDTATRLGLSLSAWATMTLVQNHRPTVSGVLPRGVGAARYSLFLPTPVPTADRLRALLRTAANWTPPTDWE